MSHKTVQFEPLTQNNHWQEWVERCAIVRCATGTASALRRFARERFVRYLAMAVGNEAAQGACPDARGCFHLLETYCCVGVRNVRNGKQYKQWLAERDGMGMAAEGYESGASLLLRDVARLFALRECRPREHVALDAPLAGSDGLTLADLLPSPEADTWVESELAARIVDKTLAELSDNQCIVFVARTCNVSLATPALLARLGVSRSRAFDMWNEVYEKLAAVTRLLIPDGDSETWLAVSLVAVEIMQKKIFLLRQVEKRWSEFFMGMEV